MSNLMDSISPASIIGDVAKGLINRLWPDPAQQAEAQRKLIELQQTGELRGMELELAAILAEANSADPFTSRARPTFLYVMYTIIMLLVFGAIVGIWWPVQVFQAAENLTKLLAALPEQLWWLFGTGYLGYTGARTFEKSRGAAK
jgi:Holin of 3TMs, for gene-transfer release